MWVWWLFLLIRPWVGACKARVLLVGGWRGTGLERGFWRVWMQIGKQVEGRELLGAEGRKIQRRPPAGLGRGCRIFQGDA